MKEIKPKLSASQRFDMLLKLLAPEDEAVDLMNQPPPLEILDTDAPDDE